jgi:hypothetical protein
LESFPRAFGVFDRAKQIHLACGVAAVH